MLVRKSIVFNTADPDQNDLVKHAELRTNFSGYVKRLIQRDMERCNFLRDVENWGLKGVRNRGK